MLIELILIVIQKTCHRNVQVYNCSGKILKKILKKICTKPWQVIAQCLAREHNS